MANTDPQNPTELGAPFFQARVAVAMELEVEIVFSRCAAKLAVKGVAERLRVQKNSHKTVYGFIEDAKEAGVKFKICSQALDLWDNDLIPEVMETVGGAYVISHGHGRRRGHADVLVYLIILVFPSVGTFRLADSSQ